MDAVVSIDKAEFASRLLSWYDVSARDLPWRKDKTPYRIWVSEIMLQQTRVETVIPYYRRFLQSFPTIESLAACDEEALRKLWEGLGYYRRAKHLKEASIRIMERHGGVFPSAKEDIEALPGIGAYTSGAIRSIAFEQKAAAVDGNVLRVFARLTGETGDLAQTTVKRRLTERVEELLPDRRNGDFTQALMELGATVCLPNGLPKCEVCPFSTECVARNSATTASIPLKTKQTARRVEDWTVFVLCSPEGRIHVNKRPGNGLLANLWEFDKTLGHLSEQEAKDHLNALGVLVRAIRRLPDRTHVFSHVEWRMTAYRVDVASDKTLDDGLWVSVPHLKEDFSIPTAVRAYLDLSVEEARSA